MSSDEQHVIDQLNRELDQTNRGLIALHTELEAAREAEAQLAAIVRATDDAILSAGPDGAIQTWNPGAERLLGYPEPEILGRPLGELMDDDERAEFEALLERVRRGEHAGPHDGRARRQDGSPVDVSISVSAMLDVDGDVRGTCVVLRDITDRLQAAAALAAARSEQQLGEERDRIATSLSQAVIRQLFAVEMKLAGAADRVTDAVARDRVTESLRTLDETINHIRATIFRPDGIGSTPSDL